MNRPTLILSNKLIFKHYNIQGSFLLKQIRLKHRSVQTRVDGALHTT